MSELSEQLKPGQSVRVEVTSTPKARHCRIALNNIFRHSKATAARWAQHNGEPRLRESMKTPRIKYNRRRTQNRQRYQLLVGANCEIEQLTTNYINDLLSVARHLQVTILKESARPQKPYIAGFQSGVAVSGKAAPAVSHVETHSAPVASEPAVSHALADPAPHAAADPTPHAAADPAPHDMQGESPQVG